MKVEYIKDREKRRVEEQIEKREIKWEHTKTPSIVVAVRKAKELGWGDKKVQVRYDKDDEMYYVEPYEKGCGCRGLLRYVDFYGAPDRT